MKFRIRVQAVALLLLGSAVSDACAVDFPAIIVRGDLLVLNDGSNRRYFVAGMVDNEPNNGSQLSRYDHDDMENEFKRLADMGATGLRWNAFLRGLDLVWDGNGRVSGLKPGCFSALRDAADLAERHGMLLQVTLATAHFLRYGRAGKDKVVRGIRNGDRVNNNLRMISTDDGIQAYLENVIDPMIDSIGPHPGLFGFLIFNEGYGTVRNDETPLNPWSDVRIHLVELQRFINRVAGRFHKRLPGALISASIKPTVQTWYDDDALIAAGGDPLGTLDIYQYQYYPKHTRQEDSPFHKTVSELIALHGGSSKPAIAGEFPVVGLEATSNNPVAMTLLEAYGSLWKRGFSGGFTWSNRVYARYMDPSAKKEVQKAYRYVADTLLNGLTLRHFRDRR